MKDKLILPFDLVSDQEAEVIKDYDVWDEAGQIARPAIFVVDAAGFVAYVYVGQDFADRPGDAPVFEALGRAAP